MFLPFFGRNEYVQCNILYLYYLVLVFLLSEGKMRVFSDFSAVYLLFSLWYSPAKGQIGGTQHYGKRVIEMGKWCQAGRRPPTIYPSRRF